MRRYPYRLYKQTDYKCEKELLYEYDPECMGDIVTKLIPCLKPDLDETKKTNKNMM